MKKSTAITHPIIQTASRLEAIANRFVFVPMGTSFASMRILRILDGSKSLTSKMILGLAGGTKSNVSQRLKHLEEHGFIIKDHAMTSDDRRKVSVKITAKGKERLDLIDTRMKKAQICLNKLFSEEEIENHLKFFKKINKIIDQEERNLIKLFK